MTDKRQPALLNALVEALREGSQAAERLAFDLSPSHRPHPCRWCEVEYTLATFAQALSAASSGDPVAQEAVARMLGMERFGQAGVTEDRVKRHAYIWPALPSEPPAEKVSVWSSEHPAWKAQVRAAREINERALPSEPKEHP